MLFRLFNKIILIISQNVYSVIYKNLKKFHNSAVINYNQNKLPTLICHKKRIKILLRPP